MSTNLIKKEPVAAEVITHDVEPLTVHTDSSKFSRMGWLIILVGFGGFLLWACLAPLDKGVPMTGALSAEGNRKAVQHQTGGVVQEIFVHDGDVVKAGQVLVRLNDTQARTQVEMTEAQYFTARASEARLLAERDGAKSVAFPKALEAYRNNPLVQSNVASQQQLFMSRQMALNNELAAYDQTMAGLKIQVQGLKESRDSKKEQMVFLKEQLSGMRDLAKDGYIARNRLLDLERTYAQVSGAISEDVGNIGRTSSQIIETGLRRSQRVQEYQREVRTQLAEVQRDAESLQSRLSGQSYDLASVDVKAPTDGVVVGSSVFTKGGVVAPGFRMMDIVPTDDALVVEGQLPVNLVDRVHAGLPVEMIFSAFNSNRTPHLPGVVTTVSADRTVDEKTGQPYYKVRARVTPEGMKLVREHKLDIQSGMPVEVLVKTGERTMMSYLLKPVFDRAKTALTEE